MSFSKPVSFSRRQLRSAGRGRLVTANWLGKHDRRTGTSRPRPNGTAAKSLKLKDGAMVVSSTPVRRLVVRWRNRAWYPRVSILRRPLWRAGRLRALAANRRTFSAHKKVTLQSFRSCL